MTRKTLSGAINTRLMQSEGILNHYIAFKPTVDIVCAKRQLFIENYSQNEFNVIYNFFKFLKYEHL